jgi:hypothetical protein
VTVWAAAYCASRGSSAPVCWATSTDPATETPSPSEMSRNTIGKAKEIAASASVLNCPSQNVSAKLYAVCRRFVMTIGNAR